MNVQEANVAAKQEAKGPEATRPGRTFVPDIDVCETADSILMWADLPGVDDKGVEISLADGVLSIQGNVSVGEYENLTPAYTEYNIGNFVRRFSVSADIDAEHIEAKLNNGVLELKLPKRERAKARRIPIVSA